MTRYRIGWPQSVAGLDSIFAVDPQDALQTFADSWGVSPAELDDLTARVPGFVLEAV